MSAMGAAYAAFLNMRRPPRGARIDSCQGDRSGNYEAADAGRPLAAGARRQAADSSRSTVRVAWNRGALATLASMARHLFLWSGS